MGCPQFNAQRLIEDKAEGEEDVQEEHPEDHDDLQDVNSWGGSQYDPEDEGDQFEEEPAEDEGHEEEEDIEQDEVRMSSIEEGEIEDLAIFSCIAEPPIPNIEDVVHHVEGSDFNAGSSTNNNNTAPDPTRKIEREEPPIDGSSNANDSIHSHLFDEDIPIADPVYIKYRDGLVFRVQLNDDWEVLSEILTENARCYICHQCRPTVRQVIFTGQHSGDEYFYLLWTCHTPVKRTRAEADIDDDESAFEISRFFANRIISESSDNNPENFVMVNGDDSDEEGEESDEEEIPDLVEIIEGDKNWHRATSMEVLSPITLAHMDKVPEQQINTEAAIEDHTDSEDEEWREHMAHHHHTPPECPYCHNCHPIIEEVYYMAADGEVFYRDRLICQSDTTTTEASGSNTRLQAMRTVYSSNVRRRTPYQGEQPVRTPQLQATLSAEIEINGVKALALFDTGSTTDSITPEFAFATKAKTFNYGTRVPIGFGGIKDEVYFDLVNIDRYDCIVSTPFMNIHKVCFDFGTRIIKINGQVIPALSSEDEQRRVDKHKLLRSQKHARPPPRETAPLKRRTVPGPLPSTST
ncbi:hypothetical protein PILCRDRAFT_16101 [Piloderma croceum F 1598]|uniref:Uncharacterized protein n=1 Tax=Piloderma croceum (strain F 1598) TaxID=765440 RepID=A0A0C3AF94_PILCF|nr:hypothetical protein PILCRDRAFT_16101 [Piloderma croceum F 1598]